MVISEKGKEYQRAYRAANKEKIKEYNKAYQEANKEKIKETIKAYREDNKEKMKEYKKAYQEANKEKIKETIEVWNVANPEKIRAYRKKQYDKLVSTPEGRLIKSIRSRIHKIIKINHKVKNKHTLELLGCDGKFLKKHLQKKFSKGMSWNNYGEWHVDHIIPINYFLKNFDFNDVEIQKECFNYKNLQPLWSLDNLKKGSKI